MKHVEQVVMALVHNQARVAVKFISPTQVVRACIRRARGKVRYKGNINIALKMGKPNYQERQFIKACVKAKEPFPVKKIRLIRPAAREN